MLGLELVEKLPRRPDLSFFRVLQALADTFVEAEPFEIWWADRPRAIWRTTEIRTGPLNSVDERFAWDEGEGQRTREWWLSAHRRFFGQRAAAQGFAMHDEIETVFERFEIVWPPEIADARQLK